MPRRCSVLTLRSAPGRHSFIAEGTRDFESVDDLIADRSGAQTSYALVETDRLLFGERADEIRGEPSAVAAENRFEWPRSVRQLAPGVVLPSRPKIVADLLPPISITGWTEANARRCGSLARARLGSERSRLQLIPGA